MYKHRLHVDNQAIVSQNQQGVRFTPYMVGTGARVLMVAKSFSLSSH